MSLRRCFPFDNVDVSNSSRIVILGKTGAGKSSVVNTIFGKKLFLVNHTLKSETQKCQAKTKSVNGRNITLIDTPGFFDTDRSEKEVKSEIVRCITEFAPGPHAFLILLKVEKYTEHEQAVISKINQYFSEEVFKYATVLFTHGDQLPEGKTIENFVRKNKLVRDLVKKCGGRCHVVDNKYWKDNQQDEYRSNQFQVEELLKTIDTMVEANKGRCYTNEMLEEVEERIKQEMQRIRQSPGNMSEEEIREEAKDRAFNRLMINLAGITTGVLLGALFGVVLMVGEVFKVLKKAGTGTAAAVIGGTAEVIGGTAAAVIGGTAVMAAGIVGGAVAAAGAIKGGFTGYDAAQEANTPGEAAKMAAQSLMKEVRSVFVAEDKTAENKSESEPLISFDS